MKTMRALLLAICAFGLLCCLVLVPAGDMRWATGWRFIVFTTAIYLVSAGVLARLNPSIFSARRRLHAGTKRWDRILLALTLPLMALVVPLAALDGGRQGWSDLPPWLAFVGYGLMAAAIAVQTWAQAINPFFEPGVRIQRERGQHVVQSGPYRVVRHPGYASAVLLLTGAALALTSYWSLLPAAAASALLVLRTLWEDRLLMDELPGYVQYACKTRYRLVPFVW